MNTDILLKEFEEILTLEIRAKHFYDHYIEQVDDPEVKEILTSIRDDEKMHVKVAEELIEIIS
jgi:hypothetical protein